MLISSSYHSHLKPKDKKIGRAISGDGNNDENITNIDATNNTANTNFESIFTAQLKDKLQKNTYQGFLEQIDLTGKQLEQNSSLHNYNAYKQALQRFFREAIPHAYQVSVHHGKMNLKTLEQKNYLILGEINGELAHILSLLKQREQGKIDLLAKITHIKGLLLDLKQ